MTGTTDDAARWREHYALGAAAWTKWAETLAEQQDKVNQLLLDAAGIGPGMSVIDLASGAGEPALSCAMRVGPQGRVQATDAVAGMVDGLRTRIARRGLSNVTADTAPMERLPYGDASFDAATCRYGLMYVDDPVAALRDMWRVARRRLIVFEPNRINPGHVVLGLTRTEERRSLLFSPGHVRRLVRAATGREVRPQRCGLLFPNVTPLPLARLLVRLPYRVPVIAISQLAVVEKS